jgi:hypothetical protein
MNVLSECSCSTTTHSSRRRPGGLIPAARRCAHHQPGMRLVQQLRFSPQLRSSLDERTRLSLAAATEARILPSTARSITSVAAASRARLSGSMRP